MLDDLYEKLSGSGQQSAQRVRVTVRHPQENRDIVFRNDEVLHGAPLGPHEPVDFTPDSFTEGVVQTASSLEPEGGKKMQFPNQFSHTSTS
jgi:hypothetical protein